MKITNHFNEEGKKYVFNDIEIIPGMKLSNIVIKDYFPQKIVDNFEFAHITSPDLGNVTEKIDKDTNCITWTIPELDAGKTASLQYKLTLKDNYSKDILDKIIPTNEKVDITDDQGDDASSTDSPKIKVTEDPQVLPESEIPQTGTKDFIIFFGIIILGAFGIYQYLKYKRI